MIYDGSEKRLQTGDLAELAATIRCTEAHLRTVIEVETSGKGFDSQRHVEFLFEPHIFYKKCPKDKLQEAIRKGYAYPHWKGPGSYPKTPALRWAMFQSAAQLDETAAISSASWGLGQIMGSEYAEAGYSSPQEMLVSFYKGEKEQVAGMVSLIKHRGLDADLRRFPEMAACRHFALRYNGAAYEKNNYHNKLHDAYVRWSQRLKATKDAVIPKEEDDDTTLRMGDYDKTPNGPIRQMQQLFKDKGYSIVADGKFGGGTRAVILAWKGNQEYHSIKPEMTIEDVQALIKSPPMPIAAARLETTAADLKPTSEIVQKTSLGKQILGWGGGVLGVGQAAESSGALDKAQDVVDKASQAKGIVSTVKDIVPGGFIVDLFHFMMEWKFPLLCGVVVVGFILMNQIQKRRVDMHKNAEVA